MKSTAETIKNFKDDLGIHEWNKGKWLKSGQIMIGKDFDKTFDTFVRTLLEAFGEEIINLIPKYGDEHEIEAFRAEQRLKVKEILLNLK